MENLKEIEKMIQNGQTETKMYVYTSMSKFVRSKKVKLNRNHEEISSL